MDIGFVNLVLSSALLVNAQSESFASLNMNSCGCSKKIVSMGCSTYNGILTKCLCSFIYIKQNEAEYDMVEDTEEEEEEEGLEEDVTSIENNKSNKDVDEVMQDVLRNNKEELTKYVGSSVNHENVPI